MTFKVLSLTSESKTVRGIFQLHDSGAGKGKGSSFISYGVKNTTALNTPLQTANFSIAARLAVLVAGGRAVKQASALLGNLLKLTERPKYKENNTKEYFSPLWCSVQISVSKSNKRGRQALTLINLRGLNNDLEEQAKDARVLGILITALQGHVETASNIGRLAVTQLEHLRVAGGARDVVLHPLLLPFTVGEAVVVEEHACSHVGRNHKLPRHELVFWKAQRVVRGHQGD